MAWIITKQELEAYKIAKQPKQVADLMISWQWEENMDKQIFWRQETDLLTTLKQEVDKLMMAVDSEMS